MDNISREFISEEHRTFRMHIGTTIASALAGFIAGVLSASIIFFTMIEALEK